MSLHILGICGTFMGGIAALARELGEQVEGSDQNVYPPMSTQLEALGIALKSGYRPEHLQPKPELVIVGNAISRGNPAIEWVMNEKLPFVSGPAWLGQKLLPQKRVLAVAGTHGKTTTTSLLAWLLEAGGKAPGFLVGGVPENFGISARLGQGDAFVIEADEYDTAFFDKRSKFVHYQAEIAILNNLEFDHADIFDDLRAIETQFHHLVRTVPGRGRLIVNGEDEALARVLNRGAWTPVERFGIDGAQLDWRAELLSADGTRFKVWHRDVLLGEATWSLLGRHNVLNALAAIAAAAAYGQDPAISIAALTEFRSAKRRMELLGTPAGVHLYDDFAHHPTAIQTTLAGLRARVGTGRVIVALEPRSNSMRLGAHKDALAPSLADADHVVFLHKPELPWDNAQLLADLAPRAEACASADAMVDRLVAILKPGDHLVFMSNGGFDGVPRKVLARLSG
ncbi:UDP-N-acetylmuramate:L-alanyl-gamma-D-glutamyl-meso-diaminopimelate ligase [Ahniella affigens]|uniref:UDP-N-acetylmuramate--L-alanyl-gamma-D-glutamyl-meso-2,6-diaminoheptandioate ligase n=1 Tax=Ahniella affigens TaxID=2021234 RepID=A0A2P1PLN8_9GAMM|nr:UDP-N-acetylmuramate:L-alanyl-gamma-D-glutamyl-meso-diaminopimelate ligase [Ahniella affigens]AVP95750.1 UDP-N-acetylmuramate:L-alanyl-gamma-D-glutamyl-meso-diaminopimelate ligase [Ahniella affigens]